MDNDEFAYYFRWSSTFLKLICGIDSELQFKIRNFQFLQDRYPYIIHVFFILLIVPGFYALNFTGGPVEEKIEIFSATVEILICEVKIIILASQKLKLIRLIREAEVFWNISNRQERNKIDIYVKLGLLLTRILSVTIIATATIYTMAPLLVQLLSKTNEKLKLPFTVGIEDLRLPIYVSLYALQVISVMCVIVGFCAIDAVIPVFILHACSAFQLIQIRLHKISENILQIMVEKEWTIEKCVDETVIREMRNCIKLHVRVIRYCKTLEEVATVICMLQVAWSIMKIGLAGIVMIKGSNDCFKFGPFIIANTCQLLVYCWPSTKLSTESIAVAFAAYNLPWYYCSTKISHSVYIMMIKSQRMTKITAVKFFTMSLETFASVLSKAYSGFTVLSST